jgi:predicted 2-oxoglutarate/Fe(II)-dependent dioxygenase YbiX
MPKLFPGDPFPWFTAVTPSNPQFRIHSAAGRYIVFCNPGSLDSAATRQMLLRWHARRDLFNDSHACVFVLVRDASEIPTGLEQREPGYRILFDPDRSILDLIDLDEPGSVVVDRSLRVVAKLPLQDRDEHGRMIVTIIAQLPRLPPTIRAESNAPILIVPYVFEPAMCSRLIAYYGEHGGEDSGFMREDKGKTVGVLDHSFKRRRDCGIHDEKLREGIRARILRRLVPEIKKAFNFTPTRIERYIIACYDAGEGGYFKPHRDNTTKGTAHRRFAVTLNLNTEDYEGGELRFAEYDHRTYRAPTGGAVVFSCSMLHEATPVTKGRRYCVLPFLYDDEAAKIRSENAEYLDDPALRAAALGAGSYPQNPQNSPKADEATSS